MRERPALLNLMVLNEVRFDDNSIKRIGQYLRLDSRRWRLKRTIGKLQESSFQSSTALAICVREGLRPRPSIGDRMTARPSLLKSQPRPTQGRTRLVGDVC